MSAFELRDYQTEVLNKCVGRRSVDHPKAGLLFRIGEQIPASLILTSLAFMQDARLNNLNGDRETVNNLEAYYFATLKGMCKDQGVTTSFWKD